MKRCTHTLATRGVQTLASAPVDFDFCVRCPSPRGCNLGCVNSGHNVPTSRVCHCGIPVTCVHSLDYYGPVIVQSHNLKDCIMSILQVDSTGPALLFDCLLTC